MPFCSQCGNQVEAADRFCAKCGARQPAPEPLKVDPLSSITPRTASILCYVPGLGWICSIVVLASARFRNDRIVRFHAFQGLYLFVAYLIEDWVLKPIFSVVPHAPLNVLIHLALLGISVFMIVVTATREHAYSLPILGDLASKSVSER